MEDFRLCEKNPKYRDLPMFSDFANFLNITKFNKHFYHVVGNVVVYACLAAAIAVPFFVHHWRKRRPGSHPATDYVGRSVRRAGLLTLIGTMFIGKLVSPATRGMSRSSRRRW